MERSGAALFTGKVIDARLNAEKNQQIGHEAETRSVTFGLRSCYK